MFISPRFIQARLVCALLAVSLAITGSAIAQDLSASESIAATHTRSLTPAASQFDYVATNSNPLFPGGYTALHTYLDQQLLYPVQARSAGLEGTVRIRFRVQPTGQLTHIRVVTSGCKLLDDAALRVVNTMPPWFPAHYNGNAVLSAIELPIIFRIN